MTQLETPRLILRPWTPDDAAALFEVASDPDVGPAAGWCAHTSVDESREVIDTILTAPESYAIILKRAALANRPIGAIALKPHGDQETIPLPEDEREIGYWLGRPYWNHGFMPEATIELIRHAFADLHLDAVWSGYDEGNERSHRVQEKAGLQPHDVLDARPVPLLGEVRRCYITRLTREQWQCGQAADPTGAAYIADQQAERTDLVSQVEGISLIRAGGQTGADRGALDAARSAGVPICGWVPRGGLAEDMPDAPGLLGVYPELIETPSAGYVQRTAWNVRDSHATLIVAPDGLEPKSGTAMTLDFAKAYGRPSYVMERPEEMPALMGWIATLGRGITLNVAGPRGSKLPGVYEMTRDVVATLLKSN